MRMQKRKQQQMWLSSWRRMHEYLISLDLIGEPVPAKQDFVSQAVEEKIDREEAKAARRQAEGVA